MRFKPKFVGCALWYAIHCTTRCHPFHVFNIGHINCRMKVWFLHCCASVCIIGTGLCFHHSTYQPSKGVAMTSSFLNRYTSPFATSGSSLSASSPANILIVRGLHHLIALIFTIAHERLGPWVSSMNLNIHTGDFFEKSDQTMANSSVTPLEHARGFEGVARSRLTCPGRPAAEMTQRMWPFFNGPLWTGGGGGGGRLFWLTKMLFASGDRYTVVVGGEGRRTG